jgi:predicted ATPase/DNA-binding XRE family transcriptional regulator
MSDRQQLSTPFGEQLRRLRRLAGLSQAALAERAGMSLRGVSDLERGVNRTPRRETVRLLADALNLDGQARAAFERLDRAPYPTAGSIPQDGSPVPSGAAPLVGRLQEMEQIERLLDPLRDTDPSIALFAGEPGIGKTRLLYEATARASAAGWRVVAGGCTRRNGQDPYAPFVATLARSLGRLERPERSAAVRGCGWLARLLPEWLEHAAAPAPSWELPPERERWLIFAAVARFLENLSGPAGTLLVLDDLQWAGSDALDLLDSLARIASEHENRRPRLRIVGAYRSTEVLPRGALGIVQADLIRAGLAIRYELKPLSSAEARTLANSLLGDLEVTGRAHLVGRVIRQAGGIPFYLVNCAQAARVETSETEMIPGAGEGRPDHEDAKEAPWIVAETIRQRVAALPERAQEMLSVAAVIGRIVPFGLLAATLSELPRLAPAAAGDLLPTIDIACQARLLVEREAPVDRLDRSTNGQASMGAHAQYQFAHDLIHEVIVRNLGGARRVTVHRAIAVALERICEQSPIPQREREAQAAQLAYHFLHAGEPARALPYALLAGDHAAALHAHIEAEQQYRTALAMAQELSDPMRVPEALEKLGVVVQALGDRKQSAELLERALRGFQAIQDQDAELRTLGKLLVAYIGHDRLDEVLARAHRILARVESQEVIALPATRASSLASTYRGLAQLYRTIGRYDDMLRSARRAVELAHAAGDEGQLVQALSSMHLAKAWMGHDADRSVLDDLLAKAERAGEISVISNMYNNLAEDSQYAGEFAQMIAAQEQSIAAAERSQDPILLAYQLDSLAERFYYLGDWTRTREVDARTRSIMAELHRHDALWDWEDPSIWFYMLVLMEGHEDEGRRLLEQVITYAETVRNPLLLANAAVPLVESDLLAGRAEQAHLRLTAVLQHPFVVGRAARIALPFLAWAEGMLGRYAEAEAHIATLLANVEPLIRTDALRVRGLLASAQGCWALAIEALDEAMERARTMHYPYAEAKALWAYGRLEVMRDDPVAAYQRLRDALAICDQLGEGLYRKHIERDLMALPIGDTLQS